LDTPKALKVIDDWAASSGDDETAPELARTAADALLGVV
jgi:hypothetical protein